MASFLLQDLLNRTRLSTLARANRRFIRFPIIHFFLQIKGNHGYRSARQRNERSHLTPGANQETRMKMMVIFFLENFLIFLLMKNNEYFVFCTNE